MQSLAQQPDLRPRNILRPVYKGFLICPRYGRVFAIPSLLHQEHGLIDDAILYHPAVLSAPSCEELEPLIDAYNDLEFNCEPLGTHAGYQLLRFQSFVYAVPENCEQVNLYRTDEQEQHGILRARSLEEVKAKIEELKQTTPVEFAGWLTIFQWAGNCGGHPQFCHIQDPPDGYRFTRSAPKRKKGYTRLERFFGTIATGLGNVARACWIGCLRPLVRLFQGGPRVGLRNRIKVYAAMTRLFFQLRAGGAGIIPILRFLQSRHFQSQMLMMRSQGMTFLPSMPFTYGQKPWLIEIEDPTTLFFPFVQNGHTTRTRIRESPYFPIIKTMLEAEHCKGIVTHMKATAEMLPRLFESEIVREKITYAPLGVKLPLRYQRHEVQADSETINLLFINSWCQAPGNFYLRGGLDILEAFSTLHERYPQLRLTVRTNFPHLDRYYHGLMERSWVRVIQRFMTAEEMAELHTESHIFLLPAARIHILSLLQAMSYGLAVVTSDGWGINEYITHEQNGLVVSGRYGTSSWSDDEAAQLREDYHTTYTADPVVVQGIVDAVSRLVEDRLLRARLGRNARADVENKFHLQQWNAALKLALDRAAGIVSNGQRDKVIRAESPVLVTHS